MLLNERSGIDKINWGRKSGKFGNFFVKKGLFTSIDIGNRLNKLFVNVAFAEAIKEDLF